MALTRPGKAALQRLIYSAIIGAIVTWNAKLHDKTVASFTDVVVIFAIETLYVFLIASAIYGVRWLVSKLKGGPNYKGALDAADDF